MCPGCSRSALSSVAATRQAERRTCARRLSQGARRDALSCSACCWCGRPAAPSASALGRVCRRSGSIGARGAEDCLSRNAVAGLTVVTERSGRRLGRLRLRFAKGDAWRSVPSGEHRVTRRHGAPGVNSMSAQSAAKSRKAAAVGDPEKIDGPIVARSLRSTPFAGWFFFFSPRPNSQRARHGHLLSPGAGVRAALQGCSRVTGATPVALQRRREGGRPRAPSAPAPDTAPGPPRGFSRSLPIGRDGQRWRPRDADGFGRAAIAAWPSRTRRNSCRPRRCEVNYSR